MQNPLPGQMTVASICEETTRKLKKVADTQAKKRAKAEEVIAKQHEISEAASKEMLAANNAISSFEKLFGINNEEVQS